MNAAFSCKLQVKNPPNTVIHTIADSVKSSLGPTTYPVVRDRSVSLSRMCPVTLRVVVTTCRSHHDQLTPKDLVDDVFTATEQEIEDATKFMMERAKQADFGR